MRSLSLILAMGLALIAATLSSAQDRKPAEKLAEEKKKEPIPINITADHLVANNRTQVAIFTGNVVTIRGGLTIKSDRMEAYNDQKTKRVKRIVWLGNVRINEEQRRFATGQRAEYFDAEQKIVLTGKPKAWEEDNQMVGDKMIFFLEEDRLEVLSSPQRRVNVILFPKEEEEKRYLPGADRREKQAGGGGPGQGLPGEKGSQPRFP